MRLILFFLLTPLFALSAQSSDCPPTAIVSLDRETTLYAGIYNYIRIATVGVPLDSCSISMEGATITSRGCGGFHVYFSEPGIHQLFVRCPQRQFEFSSWYRVKPIPGPVPMLGGRHKNSSTLGNGEFKAQGGLGAVFLENFDFDIKCNIEGFTLTRLSKDGQVKKADNLGGRYETAAQVIIDEARPGDTYLFTNITARCPADKEARQMESLIYFIALKP